MNTTKHLIKHRLARLSLLLGLLAFHVQAGASDTYTHYNSYGPDEYVTIVKGMSPDKKYAITAHDAPGKNGASVFHLYLTDAVTGKAIGPLEEIKDTLESGAHFFCAQWSADSQQVVIIYPVDKRKPDKAITYKITGGHAVRLNGPVDATEAQDRYTEDAKSGFKESEKIFGTPTEHKD